MTEWTTSACEELDRYLEGLRARASSLGAEPGEVTEDVRRHVEAEISAQRVDPVTGSDVRRITAKMGFPEAPQNSQAKPIILRARATGKGRIVEWSGFKQGKLVDKSRPLSMSITTVLTNVVSDLIAACERIDPACTITPLFPNGFTTASFDLMIQSRDFQVHCGRRLVRGLFPFNPFAAEFGRNYDVLVNISANDPATRERLADVVREHYSCSTTGFR